MKIYPPLAGELVIKSWCNEPEDGVILQATNLAKLPFAFKQINLMADTHVGKGMPIGGVIATRNTIIPNAVGVDIGCGMCAIRLSLTGIDAEMIKMIFGGSKQDKGGIRSAIPVGFNKHHQKQDVYLMPPYGDLSHYPVVEREWSNALHSLGTLGGGNHFIEIQKEVPHRWERKLFHEPCQVVRMINVCECGRIFEDGEEPCKSDPRIWVMIHSGSRNLGLQVCNHYYKKARELNEKWHSNLPSQELAFLPMDDELGQQYFAEMQYCVEYALANRKLMMDRITKVIANAVPGITFDPMINIAHNYARMENHFGENVLVHRKGATSAREGEIGIIPGSQGSHSYIVKGKGNTESFMSCSHGAGRRLSRTAAVAKLNLDVERKKMEDKGIVHSMRGRKDLEEADSAYKDIDVVMKEQSDLVEIVTKLEPLGVIKG